MLAFALTAITRVWTIRPTTLATLRTIAALTLLIRETALIDLQFRFCTNSRDTHSWREAITRTHTTLPNGVTQTLRRIHHLHSRSYHLLGLLRARNQEQQQEQQNDSSHEE